MLLRNALAAFFEHLPSERTFDLPFLALLGDMGFEDIHFTHGPAEFGKDFIAKRRVSDTVTQYSFQSKNGDVAQGTWRSDVMPQMFEAVVSGLSHPRFDRSLPHEAVLVITGRLTGNAPIAFQDFNAMLQRQYGKLPVDLWDRERLIEYFVAYGPDSFYAPDASGMQGLGTFLAMYGTAMRGSLTVESIERHSRAWLAFASRDRLFATALETELLASACVQSGRPYEAIVCLLAQVRTTLAALHQQPTSESIRNTHRAALHRLVDLCDLYIVGIAAARSDGCLLDSIGGASIVSYPVECARALEVCALSFFIGGDAIRSRAERCLIELLDEDGCAHPVSDRFAVTYVLATLALTACGHADKAKKLLRRVVVWVADRYEQGMGLAEFDATPLRETQFLLGYPFHGVGVEKRSSSLLATALCDLAAFSSDPTFYAEVVNEFQAVELTFQYFQPLDTVGQFHIDGDDVRQYPNVQYEQELKSFADFSYGSHVRDEPRAFALVDVLGLAPYVALMLLLRDRYFPALWLPMVTFGGPGTSPTP